MTTEMRAGKTIAVAALPTTAAAYATWRYQRVMNELKTHPAVPPNLPGVVRSVKTPWGSVSYRQIHPANRPSPTLVLIHGFGRTADSAWWPVFEQLGLPIMALDLPGHGRSTTDRSFTIELAAEAVITAIEGSGVDRPLLVGHSMGGAVGLSAIRKIGARGFAAFVGLASSAYWGRPRQWLTVAAAPYVMAPRSPVVVRAQRKESLREPEQAGRIAWEYGVRPDRPILSQAALELRRFDARRWANLDLPPTTWVVTTRDGILSPTHQLATAALLGAHRIDLAAQHSVVIEAPGDVCRILQAVAARPGGPVLVAV